jgi:hypothetical protein
MVYSLCCTRPGIWRVFTGISPCRSRMVANEEIAPMSTVQERIQENEHRLIPDRQNLAHMENSSGDGDQLRALHDALGRAFTERKFRFLNFVSDGNKNGWY